jgi:hypothetical protein
LTGGLLDFCQWLVINEAIVLMVAKAILPYIETSPEPEGTMLAVSFQILHRA